MPCMPPLVKWSQTDAVCQGSLPSRAKPTASEEATPYANIYSHTGFDIMGVLVGGSLPSSTPNAR